MRCGPLDMRMDRRGHSVGAAEIVNRAPVSELARIFFEYGEERRSRRIAKKIGEERQKKRIETTTELVEIVERCLGKGRPGRIHPATRVFQALRIEVNQEIENLREMLVVAPDILKDKGRIAIISFHSLEDRVVKEDFRSRARDGVYELLMKKPLTPSAVEVTENRRSRSAKLRAAQRSVR